jgi:hypothetical protein
MSSRTKVTLSCDGGGRRCEKQITVTASRFWKARQLAARNGWTTRQVEGARGNEYDEDFCPEYRRKS